MVLPRKTTLSNFSQDLLNPNSFAFLNLKPGLFFSPLRSRSGTFLTLLEQRCVSKLRPFYCQFYMKGVGYRIWVKFRRLLIFKVGLTHKILYLLPSNFRISHRKYKFLICGPNRQDLSNIAKQLLHLRQLDPYNLKGVRNRNDGLVVRERKDSRKR